MDMLAKLEYNAFLGRCGIWKNEDIRKLRKDLVLEEEEERCSIWKKIWNVLKGVFRSSKIYYLSKTLCQKGFLVDFVDCDYVSHIYYTKLLMESWTTRLYTISICNEKRSTSWSNKVASDTSKNFKVKCHKLRLYETRHVKFTTKKQVNPRSHNNYMVSFPFTG